jgi:hypothetical protein
MSSEWRKAINGLALLVEQALGLNPFAPALFVFSNRRRDRIKILLWERTGFWLMIKRLESELAGAAFPLGSSVKLHREFFPPIKIRSLSRAGWQACE